MSGHHSFILSQRPQSNQFYPFSPGFSTSSGHKSFHCYCLIFLLPFTHKLLKSVVCTLLAHLYSMLNLPQFNSCSHFSIKLFLPRSPVTSLSGPASGKHGNLLPLLLLPTHSLPWFPRHCTILVFFLPPFLLFCLSGPSSSAHF